MSQPLTITSDKLLLVEGSDEVKFCTNFFRHLQISNSLYQIIDIGGKDQFKNKLPALQLISNFSIVKKIGIVRDADDSAENAFQSIKGILKKCKLPIPKNLNVVTDSKKNPNVIVYIQPNNIDVGDIENLCLQSIEDEQIINCIDKFIECIKKDDVEYKKLSKRKIQVYLSTLPNSKIYKDLGTAAAGGCWNFNHSIFADYEKFLTDFIT